MADAQKKAIGRQIRKLRKAKGWSQPTLAAKIPAQEVDTQQVSKWERGIHTPRKHLEALAATLGVSEGEILAGDHEGGGETPDPFADNGNPDLLYIRERIDQIAAKLNVADLSEERAAQVAARLDRELDADLPTGGEQDEPGSGEAGTTQAGR